MDAVVQPTVVITLHEVVDHDLPIEWNVIDDRRVHGYQLVKSIVRKGLVKLAKLWREGFPGSRK